MDLNGIDRIEWPAQSPDFNPIENIWSFMKYKIRKLNPKTVQHLQDAIFDIWAEITDDFIHNLINSMKSRCEAAIKTRGGPINY